MSTNGVVGAVTRLWRFPVKSMRGERLEQAELTGQGLVGDRAYALIDVETGKVVSAKSVRLFPDLFACQAAFVAPPQPASELPVVRITLSDGTSVTSDSAAVDSVLSAYFRRDVTLARSAPEDFTKHQYQPDIENADAFGHRDPFFDMFPVSVLTTSTLAHLNKLRPQSKFDERRFRMNVIVDSQASGFVEQGWLNQQLAIGDTVRLMPAMPDPRCVMTTLAQEELPMDPEILRTLTQHNRLDLGDGARLPCAGVYAVVMAPGTIRIGDHVALV